MYSEIIAAYRLSKHSLQKHLHDDWWIWEYSFHDLRLRVNRASNLSKEFGQPYL